MKPITITIPYPPLGLSPNSRARNPFAYSRLAGKARGDAIMCGRGALYLYGDWKPKPGARYDIAVYAKRVGRQDKDNLAARLKHTFDGIAFAMDVDDAQFESPVVNWDAEHEANSVTITVSAKK